MSGQVKRGIALAVLAFALLAMAVEAWRLQTVYSANNQMADLLAGQDRPVAARESQPVPVLLARALYLARHGRGEDAKELLDWLDGQGDAQAKARASYNLGTLYLRLALDKIDGGQLEQAVPLVALAKQAYRRALQWKPAYWDAKFNFEIAMRLLPEMDRVSNGDEEEPEDTKPKALWTKVPEFPKRPAVNQHSLGLGLLGGAFGLALLALVPLSYPVQRDAYTHVAVVDITQSMNVEDYRLEGRAVSRLEYVKWNLRHALPDLPCGSKLGLAVFTERRPFLLFEPIEVCSGFAALDAAIAQLDWRMAWEADSRIADSLRKSLDGFGADGTIVFITDGQEAPPINPRYRPDLQAYRGKAKGVIIGVGGLTPMPIPKFNAEGGREGFYREDEVLQRSTFGLPEMAPDEMEGYSARNNPFGNPKTGGTEHLSALREDYLRQLSQETGLLYRRLETPESFRLALLEPALAKAQTLSTDLRLLPASLALLALLASYALPWLISTTPNPPENPPR